jgi:hypothetical protein
MLLNIFLIDSLLAEIIKSVEDINKIQNILPLTSWANSLAKLMETLPI